MLDIQPAKCSLSSTHALKALERISNERQCHVSGVLVPKSVNCSPLLSACVVLRDLVDGEVADIGCGLQVWLEWSADAAKLVPDDAAEEGVGFDIMGTVLTVMAAEAVVDVAKHAVEGVVS